MRGLALFVAGTVVGLAVSAVAQNQTPNRGIVGLNHVAISVPDLGAVMRRARGRALPFVWHWLRRHKLMDRVRVGFLGIKPEYQHTGIAAKFYVEHFDVAARHPRIHGGEMGWILEANEAMNRGMEMMGGRVVKRYRMYERVFS